MRRTAELPRRWRDTSEIRSHGSAATRSAAAVLPTKVASCRTACWWSAWTSPSSRGGSTATRRQPPPTKLAQDGIGRDALRCAGAGRTDTLGLPRNIERQTNIDRDQPAAHAILHDAIPPDQGWRVSRLNRHVRGSQSPQSCGAGAAAPVGPNRVASSAYEMIEQLVDCRLRRHWGHMWGCGAGSPTSCNRTVRAAVRSPRPARIADAYHHPSRQCS